MTVGLAANFLRLIQLGQLRHEDGTAVTNSPQSIKDYILSIGYSREPVNGRNRKGIYNGAALAGQSCPWTPNNPSRFRREENEGKCVPPLSAPAKTTTTTKPPAPTQTTPLERKHVVCEDAYSGHGDIIGDTVTYLGTEACNQWTSSSQSGHISSTSEGFNITELSSYQVHYTYSLHWIDGCTTTVSAMSIESPLGGDGPTCPEIFRQDFENCKYHAILNKLRMFWLTLRSAEYRQQRRRWRLHRCRLSTISLLWPSEVVEECGMKLRFSWTQS